MQQRTVFGRQVRNQVGQGGLFVQSQLTGHVALVLFAFASGGGDGFRLRVDGGNALQQVLGLAGHDHRLLLVKQGKHFAILLEFFAERFDEVGQEFFHGWWRSEIAALAGWEPSPPTG